MRWVRVEGRGGTSALRLAQLDENPLIAAAQGFNQ